MLTHGRYKRLTIEKLKKITDKLNSIAFIEVNSNDYEGVFDIKGAIVKLRWDIENELNSINNINYKLEEFEIEYYEKGISFSNYKILVLDELKLILDDMEAFSKTEIKNSNIETSMLKIVFAIEKDNLKKCIKTVKKIKGYP
jgi:nitrate reductase NapAB chaperone NapD